MKKYFITFIMVCLFTSCSDDDKYERLNQDPKNPTEASEEFLFSSATVSLGDFMASPNVNINIFRFISQYLTATTYVDEPNYDLTNRNIPQSQWSEIYRDVLLDLDDAKTYVNENTDLSQGEKDARLGQIEVLQVYAWQVLVDTFGDIPYTEALQAETITLPAYDDAGSIYVNLIERLQNARTLLSSGQGFVGADVVYGGDMSKWNKFNNSLQLRLAMRISDSNSSLSQSAAEDAASNGVFIGNQDNAIIVYQSSPPNTNPLWEDLVQSGRSDYVAANTIVDIMNDLDDPRRMYYFDENLGAGVYEGGIYGSQNPYSSSTHMGESFLDPTHPGILLDFAEVSFHLATATSPDLNYAVFGDAPTHYENGITASMNYAGIDDQVVIDDYLSQPDVSYNSTNSNALIGTQFWIAMYDNPLEGWSVWRKYDEPTLNLPGSTGNPVPLRYTYPINEQNLNEANYNAASQAIGGDSQQTRLFWDVN
jgi:hypothetical protein